LQETKSIGIVAGGRGKAGMSQDILPADTDWLQEFLGDVVVIDLRSTFVCLGKLHRAGPDYLEVRNADFHDLRDTHTTRENYVAASQLSGVKRNRKRVLLPRGEIVAISRLADVAAD
jgi:hypothetical protein